MANMMESKTLAALSSPDFWRRYNTACAYAALEMVQNEFNTKKNPYDQNWKQRKHQYPHPLLDKSGTLKNSLRVQILDTGFIIESDTDYAVFHQKGTKYIDQRMITPEGSTPKNWDIKFQEILGQMLREING